MKKQTRHADGSFTPVRYAIHEEPQSEGQTAAHGEQPRFENRTAYIGQSSSNKEKKEMYPPDGGFASGGDLKDELQAVYDRELLKP